MTWRENLEEFIKNLDPNNLELPDDFDPTFTVEYDSPRYNWGRYSSMNFWVKHHPNHEVPYEIIFPYETFIKNDDVVSPLSTWIMHNKTGTIPLYLTSYIEKRREDSIFRSCMSEWVIFRDDDIPLELWEEINSYTERTLSDEPPYNTNVATAWIYFREDRPLPKVMWPLLGDIDCEEGIFQLAKFWIINHPGEPFPRIVETFFQRGDWDDRGVYELSDSFAALWVMHRSTEEIPEFLLPDPVFYCGVQEIFEEIGRLLEHHPGKCDVNFVRQLIKLLIEYQNNKR